MSGSPAPDGSRAATRRMRSSSVTVPVLAGVALSFVLAGCGSNDDDQLTRDAQGDVVCVDDQDRVIDYRECEDEDDSRGSFYYGVPFFIPIGGFATGGLRAATPGRFAPVPSGYRPAPGSDAARGGIGRGATGTSGSGTTSRSGGSSSGGS